VTGEGSVLLASAGAVAAVVLGAWLLSVLRRDASIMDVAWGLGFVAVAWVSFALADGAAPRKVLVVVLTTVWGLRLAGHLAWRAKGEKEDFRYRELRARYGKRFALMSLLVVFAPQGLAMWVVSLPVQLAQLPASPAGLTALDFIGVAVWAVGMFFETVGDLQLARFRADARNRDEVLDRGLWRYTRHPNYFGDFCVWWGICLIGLAADEWWSLAGALMMSCILLRISGVPIMERHLRRDRPKYDDYARRTSGFFPRPPRSLGL
jgi:steroid 5-alpha reductase family enzyme